MKSFRIIPFVLMLLGAVKGQPSPHLKVHDIIVQSDCIVVYLSNYVEFDIVRVTITRQCDGKQFEWLSYTAPARQCRVVIPIRWNDLYPGMYNIDLSMGFPARRVQGQFEKEL